MKEAELKAQQIVDEAHKEVLGVKFEYERIRRELNAYRAKIESTIKSQLRLLDDLEYDDKQTDTEAV